MKHKCTCNKTIESKFNEKEKLFFFFCDACKIGGKGKTEADAKKAFITELTKTETALTVPKNKADFPAWVDGSLATLAKRSARFVDGEATERMIRKNQMYIVNADLKKAWDTTDGRMSIVEAMNDALYIGATLPEMGSIVPFKDVVEFIPAVAAFRFALTSGKNAPFSNIHIDALHENDIYEMSREDGNFHFKITKIGMPRGEIVGVVVQAVSADGVIIGEAYDEPRLMGKAEQHSVSYKYYLRDIQALRKAQAEGKEFIEKKPGWKMYEKDITNPYAGADKPEMLKKLAGKSFLTPFMKIRNAVAVADEGEAGTVNTPLQSVNAAIKDVKHDIQDADYVIEDEPVEPVVVDAGVKKDSGLFGGDGL